MVEIASGRPLSRIQSDSQATSTELKDSNPWHLNNHQEGRKLGRGLPKSPVWTPSPPEAFWGDDTDLQKVLADTSVKAAVAHTRVGSYLLKYTRRRWHKPHERFFQIDYDYSLLIWVSPKKSKAQTCIALCSIVDVVPGWRSTFFKKKFEKDEESILNLAIEIITDKRRRLRLLCPRVDIWKHWCTGLVYASRKARQRKNRQTEFDDQYVRQLWTMAGLNEETSMYFDALLDLLCAIGVVADGRYVWEVFESFNLDGSSNIEFDELMPMLEQLFTHQDVLGLYEIYADPTTKMMSEEGLLEFLQDVQQTSTVEQQLTIDFMRSLREPFIKEGNLTHIGFCHMLTTKVNSILSPARISLHQDMTKPFCDYWIASCVFDDTESTRFGSSTTPSEALKELVINGMRCVHFYLVDGRDDEPNIYLKSGTRFGVREALTILKRFAFLNSPFPFIISLSISLGTRQKHVLGHLLQTVLGPQLVSAQEKPESVSPSSLQEKFLVRMKKTDQNGAEMPEGTEIDESLQHQQRVIQKIDKLWSETQMDYAHALQPPLPPLTPREQVTQSALSTSPRERLKSGGPISNIDLLSSLGFFQGIPLETLSTRNIPALGVAMLNNDQFYELTREPEIASHIVRYTKNGLIFVYSPSREFSPAKPWMYGAQLVCVSHNSKGKANLLHISRFHENGGCGYVLKPAVLRQDRQTHWDPCEPLAGQNLREAEEIPIELSVKVLTARQLPIPWQAGFSEERNCHPSRCVNPYVKVSVIGVPMDCDSRQTNAVTGNGFNPRWDNEQFVFEITVPSLAMLVFEVEHFDTLKCQPLASAALPIMAVQQGFRWVSLMDMMLREIRWCGLLCQIAVRAAKSRMMLTRGSSNVFNSNRRTTVVYNTGFTGDSRLTRTAVTAKASFKHTGDSIIKDEGHIM